MKTKNNWKNKINNEINMDMEWDEMIEYSD